MEKIIALTVGVASGGIATKLINLKYGLAMGVSVSFILLVFFWLATNDSAKQASDD